MLDVRTINLEETIASLKKVDRDAARMLKSEIRRVAKPTLAKAKSYAAGLGSSPTGSYAGSLSLKTRANGVAFVSTDPGGGVIEFANIGAVILQGPRKGQRCPVPHGSNPPRALMRATLEDEQGMVRALNDALENFLNETIGG